MKQFIVFVLIAALFFSCSQKNEKDSAENDADQQQNAADKPIDTKDLKLEWKFVTTEDAEMNPSTDIALIVNGKTFEIGNDFYGGYEAMTENNPYHGDIPPNAIASCGSFWAGLLTIIEVEREGNDLVLKIGEIDEMSEEPIAFKELKRIKLSDI